MEPACPAAAISCATCNTPHTFVPVDAPTLRPKRSLSHNIAATEAASGTFIMRSITPLKNEASMRGRPMPSMRLPFSPMM